MDYEKKYKNALEWARQVMNGKIGFVRDEVQEIFSELAESEDERVRKEIVEFINRVYERQALILTDEEKDDMIAWLEKQGEKPQGKSALEAAKSPKQEWSEEDFSYIDELTDFFEHCGELHQPQANVVNWLKSLKERIGCEGYCTTMKNE